ncbi:roadblock/LC7 domain-containing protein [Streptomyces sp. NPDC005438]|uniref:roadblock/LC7 domain-containing protein n=1 Tax=Streptomyces sp. NPDC005438 TaxID=3156880 RepID=UPI0033B12E07
MSIVSGERSDTPPPRPPEAPQAYRAPDEPGESQGPQGLRETGAAEEPRAPEGEAGARLRWLLDQLTSQLAGVHAAVLVSTDGLQLLSTDNGQGPPRGRAPGPEGSTADLATVVSGLASLTAGTAKLMRGGKVLQTMVTMRRCALIVMGVNEHALLGLHVAPHCDLAEVGYRMTLTAAEVGTLLDEELRERLRELVDGTD